MRSLLVVVVCCFSVVCLQASAVLEVTGHVGEQVSIPCFGSWTENNSSEDHTMFFCKGVCSAKNNVVQTRKMRSAATWRGRYSIGVNGGDRAFSAAIRDVRRRDAGTYCCGMEDNLSVMQQEVHLRVLKASTVLLGSPLPTAPPHQTETETPPQGSLASGTETPPTASTLPATEDTRNHTAAGKLKDTTVVIIVSVSLAFLVCAFIPLIFYRYWFSNKGGENKVETENCEENAAVPSTQVAMRLQSLDADTESSIENLSQ